MQGLSSKSRVRIRQRGRTENAMGEGTSELMDTSQHACMENAHAIKAQCTHVPKTIPALDKGIAKRLVIRDLGIGSNC